MTAAYSMDQRTRVLKGADAGLASKGLAHGSYKPAAEASEAGVSASEISRTY
jgi:hypothetical protein